MTPNLRSVVAQGWRSIRSRRNFSSSPGSNDVENFLLDTLKDVVPSFKTFNVVSWTFTGFAIYGGLDIYELLKVNQRVDKMYEKKGISDE